MVGNRHAVIISKTFTNHLNLKFSPGEKCRSVFGCFCSWLSLFSSNQERFRHFLHSCISSDSLRSLRSCANVKCNQLVISNIQDVRAAKREHAHRIYCWYSSYCTSRQLWVINDTRVALLAHTPAVVPCQPLIRKFLRLIRVTKKYTVKYAKLLSCTCGTAISWLNFIFKPAGLEIN